MLSDKFRCLRSRNTVALAVATVLGFRDLSDNEAAAPCARDPRWGWSCGSGESPSSTGQPNKRRRNHPHGKHPKVAGACRHRDDGSAHNCLYGGYTHDCSHVRPAKHRGNTGNIGSTVSSGTFGHVPQRRPRLQLLHRPEPPRHLSHRQQQGQQPPPRARSIPPRARSLAPPPTAQARSTARNTSARSSRSMHLIP